MARPIRMYIQPVSASSIPFLVTERLISVTTSARIDEAP